MDFIRRSLRLRIRHFRRTEIERRVGEVLDLLGLADMRDAKAQNLSGGAQQRISIGRALEDLRESGRLREAGPGLSGRDGDRPIPGLERPGEGGLHAAEPGRRSHG